MSNMKEEINELKEYREKLSKLSEEEEVKRNIYLKKFQTGEIQWPPIGKLSLDKNWLKKYVPFIKEENWIILTKEIGDYSSQNRDIIKGENIKKREESYTHSILLDDEQKVLREAKRLLKEKCTIYHVSSAII